MKKAAVVSVALVTVIGAAVAGRSVIERKSTALLIANNQETSQKGSIQEVTQENPGVPTINPAMIIPSGVRVGVVSKNTKGQFWELIKSGMEAAVQDVNAVYGYKKEDQVAMTFEGPDDELDVEGQINTLDAVIAENPDALCISAGDMESCQAQLEAARENGIPVVAFDANVSETDLICAYRGTDNTYTGEIAAEKLAEAIGEKGKVAVFSAQEKTKSIKDRSEGFQNKMKDYPDIEITDILYEDQVEDMNASMLQVLEQNPDLAGVFCTNSESTEAYLNLEKPSENLPVLVGVDATSRQQEAIRSGEELGAVSQNPYAMGYQTMLAALQAINLGQQEKIEKNVLLAPVWVDNDNMGSLVGSGYIYGMK